MFEIIVTYKEAFLKGLSVTLALAAITWGVGLTFGSILGFLSAHWSKSWGVAIRGVSFLLSGIPILVLLFWLHYPAQQILGVVVNPFYTAALVLSLVNVFGVEMIVRGAIEAVPREFRDAGRVSGLSGRTIIFRIDLPLILRHVLSPLLVSQVVMLHMTLFASLISVEELLRMAQRINSQIYKPVEIYTALGLFFLIVSLPVNGFALYLKQKFGRDFSER
jgi:ABC-type amino acid transport system permease subunit